MTRRLYLATTTVADAEQAARMGRILVEEDLAVCVQAGSPVRSWYRWQGQLEDAVEVPMLLKIRHDRLDDCLERLAVLHPYDTPEILAWPADRADAGYLAWAYGGDPQ